MQSDSEGDGSDTHAADPPTTTGPSVGQGAGSSFARLLTPTASVPLTLSILASDKPSTKGKKTGVAKVTRVAIEAAASALEGTTADAQEAEMQQTVITAAVQKREYVTYASVVGNAVDVTAYMWQGFNGQE